MIIAANVLICVDSLVLVLVTPRVSALVADTIPAEELLPPAEWLEKLLVHLEL